MGRSRSSAAPTKLEPKTRTRATSSRRPSRRSRRYARPRAVESTQMVPTLAVMDRIHLQEASGKMAALSWTRGARFHSKAASSPKTRCQRSRQRSTAKSCTRTCPSSRSKRNSVAVSQKAVTSSSSTKTGSSSERSSTWMACQVGSCTLRRASVPDRSTARSTAMKACTYPRIHPRHQQTIRNNFRSKTWSLSGR